MEVMDEQRTGPRIPVDIPVKLVCAHEGAYLARIVSINKNGFLCVMKKSLPLQTPVKIIMLIPSQKEREPSKNVSASGVVVRENLREIHDGDLGHAVAVKFLNFCADNRLIFEQFITFYTSQNN